ncbi:EF-hand domain-containing protein [bacterium]|nr:EF-hand domain-containing protein [bacterium]
MANINGSIISGVSNGLLNTYSQLANIAGSGGVTLSSINKARTNSENASTLNQSFASYIETNFTNLDKNHDGKISPDEMQSMSSMLNTGGLTSAQLTQLGTATGLSQDTISQVLAHFADIDKNHDGKVTSAEINSYNAESSKMKLADEFRMKAASDMSMFYGSESSDTSTKSLMSFKYLD